VFVQFTLQLEGRLEHEGVAGVELPKLAEADLMSSGEKEVAEEGKE
jgi:hypothetical protein